MSFGRLTGVIFSFWAGLVFSLAYSFLAGMAVNWFAGSQVSQQFYELFFGRYGGFWTGTLCFMVLILTIHIFRTVPTLIETDIPRELLEGTGYYKAKEHFEHSGFAIGQSTIFFAIGFLIYSINQFDTDHLSRAFLTVFSSLQFAFGGLLGRKLWWTAHMLKSIETIDPPSKMIEKESLQKLILTVNVFTFLTFITTLVHTYFHFNMPFQFRVLPSSVAEYLPLVPALLALPVLVLFNFIPRASVNKIYVSSIEKLKSELELQISAADDTNINNQKLLIDYKKFLHEEFRYKQRAALSELPIVFAIITLVATLLIRLMISGQ